MNTMQLLQLSLDTASMRQQVYANNIANAETPNYKRQDVAFETYFQQALENAPQAKPGEYHIPIPALNGNSSTIPDVQPTIVTDETSKVDNNGNNVDLTSEMTNLAENQVRYNVLVQDVTDRLQRLRTAIQGS
ncbi:flagellar basal body rod protein FlgB [Alicyclobacillus dauci]|uniref:Flagellar basal body rod protein FlgB n=1 Tax=Alicyclobacillus dauci TaxID=1475485 RepID=A0ABY6YY24_9BACL|nr:flagellar basal body rod protein FlgB [Alicyclobacillus dauci]WAH35410.1 flagellar basal body rod protein FlgB [Alicyclobacillus dauci]